MSANPPAALVMELELAMAQIVALRRVLRELVEMHDDKQYVPHAEQQAWSRAIAIIEETL